MQHVTSPPALTCNPVRLEEEFPRWLEKVSSRLPGGVVLVLDSIDLFQVLLKSSVFRISKVSINPTVLIVKAKILFDFFQLSAKIISVVKY